MSVDLRNQEAQWADDATFVLSSATVAHVTDQGLSTHVSGVDLLQKSSANQCFRCILCTIGMLGAGSSLVQVCCVVWRLAAAAPIEADT